MAHEKIWMKRVLIPLWIIQLIVCVILIGASGIGLWAVNEADDSEYFDDTQKYDDAVDALNIGAAISLAFGVFTVLLIIVEIIMAAMHKLKPVAHIVMQCIKSLIWTVYFILSIVGAAISGGTGLSLFLIIVLFLACMGQLIYGGVILHRYRKGTLHRGNYSPFNAEAGHNQTFGYTGTTAYQQQTGYTSVPPPQGQYKPTGAAGDYYGGGGAYEMHGNPTRY